MNDINQYEEYERYRTRCLLGLRSFPRSVGMIAGAINLLATQDPYNSLQTGVAAWLVTYLMKSMLLDPGIVGTRLWSGCSLPVNAIGAYPIRWFLYITMVLIALVMGAPFSDTLVAMGGLFLYDVLIVFARGA